MLAFCAAAWGEDVQQAAARPAESGETAAGQEEGNINPIPMSWQQVKGDLTIWTAVVFLV